MSDSLPDVRAVRRISFINVLSLVATLALVGFYYQIIPDPDKSLAVCRDVKTLVIPQWSDYRVRRGHSRD